MALSLFTRHTDVQDPATWTPPGTTVVQRYRGLGGAVVLVYIADGDAAPRISPQPVSAAPSAPPATATAPCGCPRPTPPTSPTPTLPAAAR